MHGHTHDASARTQNQGNILGHRSCIRQSKIFRQNESGNTMKGLLGTPNLCWNTNKKEGVYIGQPLYDYDAENKIDRSSERVIVRPSQKQSSLNEINTLTK
jgi:hypothetical protein